MTHQAERELRTILFNLWKQGRDGDDRYEAVDTAEQKIAQAHKGYDESKLDVEFGKKIAPIVREAIGALNHTHIGYASDHDYQADPYIDKIVAAHQADIDRAVDKAIEEARQHLYTASQVRQALGKVLDAKTDPRMVQAIMEDFAEEIAKLTPPHNTKPEEQ